MLFNSLEFLFFIPIVFIVYWSVSNKSIKVQNLVILFASYVFYGWWDWRFLFLIALSTLVDYIIGARLNNESNPINRKFLLWSSILVNIGSLAFFKYCDFFISSFVDAFSFFGHKITVNSLNIILPVGISFYTFQTLSYSIDIYRGKLQPAKDFVSFAAFVSFFPQLVAGPIERAVNLLPQFYNKREFDYNNSVNGLRQILYGLLKKIVIADNSAEFANLIFDNSDSYPGSVLFMGGVFFAFQIYGDFSGYSDIAIGLSRLFSFNLMRNFSSPYFSRDIAEFWRRWHISLSTWFRDYLYIPLGGSKGGLFSKIRNTFIIFVVSGFWHGPNWTFIVWGFLNGLYFLPLLLRNKNRVNMRVVSEGRLLPSLKDFFKMSITFTMVVFGWIFFRSDNLNQAFMFIRNIFSKSVLVLPKGSDFIGTAIHPFTMIVLLVLFIVVEWKGRSSEYGLEFFAMKRSRAFRWGCYFLILMMLFLFTGREQEFIYFQF